MVTTSMHRAALYACARTHTNTLHGSELACFPGRLEFPRQCSEGELRREDSKAEMYGGGREGGIVLETLGTPSGV